MHYLLTEKVHPIQIILSCAVREIISRPTCCPLLSYLRIGRWPKLAGMYKFTIHTNATRLYIFCPSENKYGLAALGSLPIRINMGEQTYECELNAIRVIESCSLCSVQIT